MNPPFSVIFLTTLIGAAQGLFVALFGAQLAHQLAWLQTAPAPSFYVAGAICVVLLSALGLLASFFHLGHPERAWRAAAMWRTSWLSREVIALPLFIATAAAWGISQVEAPAWALPLGVFTLLVCLALFLCTGMIYACIRFLREWASPLTVINFLLLGLASGFTLATALAAVRAPALVGFFGMAAWWLTLAGCLSRSASLLRNARLKPASTLQTAIGIRHPRIVQISQGFMGGSVNQHLFFHGKTAAFLRAIKWLFPSIAFGAPLILLGLGLATSAKAAVLLAFPIQYLGLIGERWFFFAQANHPQNLYYQAIA